MIWPWNAELLACDMPSWNWHACFLFFLNSFLKISPRSNWIGCFNMNTSLALLSCDGNICSKLSHHQWIEIFFFSKAWFRLLCCSYAVPILKSLHHWSFILLQGLSWCTIPKWVFQSFFFYHHGADQVETNWEHLKKSSCILSFPLIFADLWNYGASS